MRPWSWRLTEPDRPLRLDEASPAFRPRARFEVRVHRSGVSWQVRHGVDGPVELFATGRVAMQQAREAARRVWAEVGTLSCVKLLSDDGTWETVDVFGIEPLSR